MILLFPSHVSGKLEHKYTCCYACSVLNRWTLWVASSKRWACACTGTQGIELNQSTYLTASPRSGLGRLVTKYSHSLPKIVFFKIESRP